MKKFLLSLWGIWITTTIVYLVTSYIFRVKFFNGLLGLFVPVGVGNFLGSFVRDPLYGGFSYNWLIVFPLVILTLYYGNKATSRVDNPGKRVVFNLVILLLLTMAVDLIIWHQWISWKLVRASFVPPPSQELHTLPLLPE